MPEHELPDSDDGHDAGSGDLRPETVAIRAGRADNATALVSELDVPERRDEYRAANMYSASRRSRKKVADGCV